MAAIERKSDWIYNPIARLTADLWVVYNDNFEEIWPRYNGTELYVVLQNQTSIIPLIKWKTVPSKETLLELQLEPLSWWTEK